MLASSNPFRVLATLDSKNIVDESISAQSRRGRREVLSREGDVSHPEEVRAPALLCEQSPRATSEIISEVISVRTSLKDWMKSGSFDKDRVPLVREELRSLNSELTDFCHDPLFDSVRMAALEARIQRMKLINPVKVDPKLELPRVSMREKVPMEEAEARKLTVEAPPVHEDKVSEGDSRHREDQNFVGETVDVGRPKQGLPMVERIRRFLKLTMMLPVNLNPEVVKTKKIMLKIQRLVPQR
ncbi:hypothetical protein U1Q18_049101 [Sarracenia purpurea var. burkii]